jgi:hypothetical protein
VLKVELRLGIRVVLFSIGVLREREANVYVTV